jgi:3-keto-5-aminohexanoate cleavage enzyme
MNPNLPITPIEQGIAAAAAVEEGASIIHLHVREDDGSESHRLERFEQAVYEIHRRVPEAIIEVSTRGASGDPMSYRANCLELETEMCSLNIGSLNIDDEVFLNPPTEVVELIAAIQDHDAIPELDMFDIGHLEQARALLERGILRGPAHFLFVLGIRGGVSGDVRNLLHFLAFMPAGSHWCALGIGRHQLSVATHAILLGGNVRVGLEDAVWYDKRTLAASNAQLVARVARVSRELGREVATPAEARELLGITPRRPRLSQLSAATGGALSDAHTASPG